MNKQATPKGRPASGPADMLAKAAEAARFLRSLGHEHRLAILCALLDGPSAVGQLAERLDLAQPKVSQHLAILREEGLVSATRAGTSRLYRAENDTARAIVAALQAAFCPPAAVPVRRRKPERKT